jgi:hypothetical protein
MHLNAVKAIFHAALGPESHPAIWIASPGLPQSGGIPLSRYAVSAEFFGNVAASHDT